MIRWRTAKDGSIWIPRSDTETEAHLNSLYLRGHGELRWYPKPPDASNLGNINDLTNRFYGQSAIVFGKGPSLDRFLTHDVALANHPLRIGLNETCLLVPNPHFTFFVDPHIARLVNFPPNCNIVCPPSMVARIEKGNGNRILFFDRDAEILSSYATAAIALATLCRWGITQIMLVGFDSFTMSDDEQRTTKAYSDKVEKIQVRPRKNAYYGPINKQLRLVINSLEDKGVMVTFYHLLSHLS